MSKYVDPRKTTWILVACFVGIAALEIVSSVINDRIANRQQEVARFTQLGNQQRLLSLNIVLLAQEYAETTDEQVRIAKRTGLEGLATDMRRIHDLLVMGDPENGIPAPDSEEIDQIVFGHPIALDETLRRYLAAVDEIAGRPWSDDLMSLPYMDEIEAAASGSLRTGIDRLVSVMEEDANRRIGNLKLTLVLSSVASIVIVIGVGLLVIVPMMRRLAAQTRELLDLARTDPLTGCHNRRSFLREGEAEFDRFRRYGGPFTVIMLDIDHFKKVNDAHGHAAGDEVIRTLARTCLDNTRKSDVLGRLGGEEFAVLLPETGIENARVTAEKLRAALEQVVVTSAGKDIRFTASLGLSPASAGDTELFQVINRADKALYAAKNGGRNRVDVEIPEEGSSDDTGAAKAEATV